MITSPETQDLARRLLAHEVLAGKTSERTEPAAFRVCEKLRSPLCVLAGVAGYRSLLSRALTLARTEAPSLTAVRVAEDGSLQSRAELELEGDGVLLIAELLGLCLDLIGAALTLRLVQDVSPHLSATTQVGTPMPVKAILQEVEQLNNVSERLESLADQHPLVEEALMSISGNVRNTAAVLEVLVLVKSKSTESVNELGTPAGIN